MPTPKVPGYLGKTRNICDVHEGDLIRHDGEIVTVAGTRIDRGPTHYVYTLLGTDESVLVRGPGTAQADIYREIPKVDDAATQAVGSDAYPFTVIAVSKSGQSITVQRDAVHYVSGSFQTNDAVYRLERDPQGSVLKARWSTKYGRFQTSGGTPIYVGNRRYYQDPHV